MYRENYTSKMFEVVAVEPLVQLTPKPITTSFEKAPTSGLSGGVIAGIVIVATLPVVITILIIFTIICIG